MALLGVARKLIKRERLFHLFFIEMSGAEPGAVKFVLLRKKQRGRAGFKAFDDVIRDGIHQLNDIALTEEFAAELVEPLDLAPALVRFVGFRADARGKLAAHNRSDQESEQCDPVLRIGDGQRPNRRQEEIIESDHRQERHGHGNGHSPHCRNC